MRARPNPPPPQKEKVSACVAPGAIRSGHLRSGQSFTPGREPIFDSFQPATRAGKATMGSISRWGWLARKKDGAICPGRPDEGTISGASWAHGALDETRRTGLLPVGPLWLRASCFVSPSREWGRPDNRATCTATCCKSPTNRSRSKITMKTNQQATAQQSTDTGTGAGHRIPKTRRLRAVGCHILGASPRVSRNTVPPCHPLA